MPDIDFTSAYRDATQGSTIKALGQRRAELQAALAARKPREVNSPWQGAAEVADSISGSIREGRMANQEAAGRQRFAELLAGGLAPDEIGEAMGLDPETTMKYQERTWAKEDKGEERSYQEGRDARLHGYDVDAALARVQAEKDAQKERFGHEDTSAETKVRTDEAAAKADDARAAAEKRLEEDARVKADKAQADASDNRTLLAAALDGKNEVSVDEAMKRGLMSPEDGTKLKDQIIRTRESEIEKNKPETFTQVTPQMVQERGLGGDIAAHPDQFQISNKTGQITPYQRAAGAPALKEQYDAQDKLASIDSHMDDLNRALELNDKVIQGPAGGWASTILGSDPTGILEAGAEAIGQKENIEATREFSQLVSAGAMTKMAEELKGSTAYQEVMHYQELFASPTATAEVRRNALNGMLNALRKHRAISSQRLESYGAEKPGDYTYTPRTAAPADAVPAAPADTGGANAAPAAPKVGDVVDGHTYQGGDPSKPESWKRN